MGNRRPNGTGADPVRSVRISDAVYEKARARAAADGTTVSHVLSLIAEGYAEGLVNLPVTVTIYQDFRSAP